LDKKVTIKTLQAMRGNQKIVMITAYDALFASLFDNYVDVILIGDSLNMSFAGRSDTLSATMDQMIYHTKAVGMGAKKSFLLFDMPFGSYTNNDIALQNAVRAYRETKADAIKIEGGFERAEMVRHLSDNAIAVFGHIGLLPQSARGEGGYSIKGKTETEKQSIIEDALALQSAGAVALIIEGVKSEVAAAVTKAVSIPVIGIGAGNDVDGQVLVWSDMLGFFEEFTPKFVKKYIDGSKLVRNAIEAYSSEVKSGEFPNEKFRY
jgi:3-methyl-2-oxobutanoate hydroxymethyltransferase